MVDKKCNHETFYIEKQVIDHIGADNLKDCGFGRGLIVCYDCGLTLKQIFDKKADIGKLTLQTELCYWGYQYNDGDCNEEKYPCVRNELCKMKAEVCW